ACRPGTISPAANTWIWNLLSLASATALAKISEPPNRVSSDLGKLDVHRHLSVGIDWAMAGAAIAVEARPALPAFRKARRFRRFISLLPGWFVALTPSETRSMDLSDGANKPHQRSGHQV